MKIPSLTFECKILVLAIIFIPLSVPSIPSLLRLQRLEHLAAKFNHKATNIESWLQDKDVMLERSDDIEGANLAEVMVSTVRP